MIVSFSHLFELLSICREANCGSLVPREQIKITVNGAMIRCRMICNNNHEKTWSSSPVLGSSGKGTFSATNVQLASYCLLTGMHITQVVLQMYLWHMQWGWNCRCWNLWITCEFCASVRDSSIIYRVRSWLVQSGKLGYFHRYSVFHKLWVTCSLLHQICILLVDSC